MTLKPELFDFEKLTLNQTLAQSGVKGMKWGVRRPVGPNGLVIKTGNAKQTSTNKAGKPNAGNRQNQKSKAKPAATKPSGKPKETMTTEELREAVNRLQLEKQYASLRTELTPTLSDELKKALKKGVMDAGTEFTKSMMLKGAQGAANAIAKKAGGSKIF